MPHDIDDRIVDIESERRVLSGAMNSEAACLKAVELLKDDDFQSQINRQVFQIIRDLYQNETIPTYAEILKESHKRSMFRKPAEIEELSYIAEHFIEGDNIKYWIDRVTEATKYRNLSNLLNAYHVKLSEHTGTADELLLSLEDSVTTLNALEIDDHVDSPEDIASFGYREIERRYLRFQEIQLEHSGIIPLDGLPTGFDALDNITLGYKPGDLIIVGAQTGHGKTAFALHTAKAIAVQGRKGLLYLNTEMSRTQIALRWGSILSGVEHDKVRSGNLRSSEVSEIAQGFNSMHQSGFYSYPCPNLTPEKMVSVSRKYKAQKDIQMLILDYVGRMDKIEKDLKEWQVLEQIVKTCKLLAQRLQITVMVLVQLNDDSSMQGARRMKNECDLFIKLVPVTGEENEKLRANINRFRDCTHRLLIDKNRDGQSGVWTAIKFDKERQTMRDAELLAEGK